MPQSSFTEKIISVSFTLAEGQFNQGGSTKIVTGLRVNAEISKGGAPTKNEARIRVYGMRQEDMNTLSTLGLAPLAVQKNLIQVQAGDSDGLTTVFQGEITGAWVNYHTPPELYFEVHAIAGYFASLNPTHPTSLKGGTPVATIFQSLAKQMGYTFQNNGVTTQIQSPYLTGSAYQQAATLAESVGLEFGIDDNILFIAPRGMPRQPKGQVPLITPTSGLIEYPVWDKQGLVVQTLLNPLYQLNGQVVIQDSAVVRANGPWRIHGLQHRISSKHPHESSWASKLHLAKVGA
jgi:hypothetical protein